MPEDDANRLRRHAEDALGGAYDPSRVLPILHRLAKHAEVGSDDALFAHLRLAELLVAKSPWRASIHARKVLALHPGDDRAWAILGLSQALLGHYRFARVAYEGAVRAAPDNPFYAHNLGHLIDVALHAPRQALPWLRRACELAPDHPDVVASLAHAHARLGDFAQARSLLAPLRGLAGLTAARAAKDDLPSTPRTTRRSQRIPVSAAHNELARLIRWVDRESPEPPMRHARPRIFRSPPDKTSRTQTLDKASHKARKKPSTKGVLVILANGLAHLPFSPKQIARAKALARDVRARVVSSTKVAATALAKLPASTTAPSAPSAHGVVENTLAHLDQPALAAAIAYAIIYVDQVPLSAGEVAAPFRVSTTRVRAAFEVLRAELDLIRGDSRYATEAR